MIQRYITGAIIAAFLATVAAAAWYRHQNHRLEHDLTLESAARQSIEDAYMTYANNVNTLEVGYEESRKMARASTDKLAKHDVATLLATHPDSTLRAINGGADSMFAAIECSSNPRCKADAAAP